MEKRACVTLTRSELLRERPFTLSLSAGFFGFYAHTGFLFALEEQDVVPSSLIGASAGSLAGGLWASGISAHEIEAELRGLRRRDFWDLGFPVGGLLKGERFARYLDELLARRNVHYFYECVIPFHSVVFDLVSRKTRLISKGIVADAIRASCSLPLMFRPVRIGWRLYLDGGIRDRAAITGTQEGQLRVLHYLPQQSPWSKFKSRQSMDPTDLRNKSEILALPKLPKVGPFHLRRGLDALEKVRRVTRAWLQEPVKINSYE